MIGQKHCTVWGLPIERRRASAVRWLQHPAAAVLSHQPHPIGPSVKVEPHDFVALPARRNLHRLGAHQAGGVGLLACRGEPAVLQSSGCSPAGGSCKLQKQRRRQPQQGPAAWRLGGDLFDGSSYSSSNQQQCLAARQAATAGQHGSSSGGRTREGWVLLLAVPPHNGADAQLQGKAGAQAGQWASTRCGPRRDLQYIRGPTHSHAFMLHRPHTGARPRHLHSPR